MKHFSILKTEIYSNDLYHVMLVTIELHYVRVNVYVVLFYH